MGGMQLSHSQPCPPEFQRESKSHLFPEAQKTFRQSRAFFFVTIAMGKRPRAAKAAEETEKRICKRPRDTNATAEETKANVRKRRRDALDQPLAPLVKAAKEIRERDRDATEETMTRIRNKHQESADYTDESTSEAEAAEELLRANVQRQTLDREADVQVSLELPAAGFFKKTSSILEALMKNDHPNVSLSFFAGPLKGPREIGKVTIWKGRIPAWLSNLVGYNCTEKGLYRSMRAVVQALFVGLSQSNHENAAEQLLENAKEAYQKGWEKAALDLSQRSRAIPSGYLESLIVLEGALCYAYAFRRQRDLERLLKSFSEPLQEWMRAFWEDLQDQLPPLNHAVFTQTYMRRYLKNRYWNDLDLLCQYTLPEVYLNFAEESESDSSEDGEASDEGSSDVEEVSALGSESDDEDFSEAEELE